MAQEDESRSQERAEAGRQIAESLARAQKVMNRYDYVKKQLAAQGVDPETSRRTYDILMDVDSAVFDAYGRLRKYIKDELEDEYWNTRVLCHVQGRPVVLGGPDGEELEVTAEVSDDGEKEVHLEIAPPENVNDGGIIYFEDYQGKTFRFTDEKHVRFEGWTTVTSHEPALLPPEGYRKTIQLLDEIRNRLGFAPEADKKTPRTGVTRDTLEAMLEWRQENMPQHAAEMED